jgi:predicted nucleic acid-binding protein
MKIPAGLRPGQAVVIDTNVLIYLFEDHPVFGAVAEYVFERMAAGVFAGLLTPVTVAELLVKPLREGRVDVADRYRRAIRHMGGVSLVSLDAETAVLAGALRAQDGLPLPDMFQVAVAMRQAAPAILTQDAQIRAVEDLAVYTLDDFAG